MPGIVAGDANDLVEPQQAPGFLVGGVFLADMDPVGVQGEGEVRPVVHDKGDAAILRDRAEPAADFHDFFVRQVLQAQLQAGDVARVQRGRKILFESGQIGNRRRGDGVKPALGQIVHGRMLTFCSFGVQTAFISANLCRTRRRGGVAWGACVQDGGLWFWGFWR